MKSKKIIYYRIISWIIFLIGAVWGIIVFGWQLIAILFLLKWSSNIDDLANEKKVTSELLDSDLLQKPHKKSKFQERLEKASKERSN